MSSLMAYLWEDPSFRSADDFGLCEWIIHRQYPRLPAAIRQSPPKEFVKVSLFEQLMESSEALFALVAAGKESLSVQAFLNSVRAAVPSAIQRKCEQSAWIAVYELILAGGDRVSCARLQAAIAAIRKRCRGSATAPPATTASMESANTSSKRSATECAALVWVLSVYLLLQQGKTRSFR